MVRRHEIQRSFAEQDDFPLVLEIHSDTVADDGLYLPCTPFGRIAMPHERAHFKELR